MGGRSPGGQEEQTRRSPGASKVQLRPAGPGADRGDGAPGSTPTPRDPSSAPAVLASPTGRRRHRHPNIAQVQWAYTKVTYFSDCTRVYEVRRPSTEPPEELPETRCTHGFFVTAPPTAKSRPYRPQGRPCSCSAQQLQE